MSAVLDHDDAHLLPFRDQEALARCTAELARRPAIVSTSAIERLKTRLAQAQRGESFVLHAGDCAEPLASAEKSSVKARLRVLLQLAALLEDAFAVPSVAIGRIAGQYAKPRSHAYERSGARILPPFRGESINGYEPSPEAREPRPERMLLAHDAALRTVALLDEVLADRSPYWRGLPDAVLRLARTSRTFAALVEELSCARGPGIDACVGNALFISHEALLLPYEMALTRTDRRSGRVYNRSAHFLWLGERTRAPEGAHATYLRSIANPIGVKLGPTIGPDDLCALARSLDPAGERGRLTLIPRLGAANVRRVLPRLITAVRNAGLRVLWSCDPMHGNTVQVDGVKVRRMADIAAELAETVAVHREMGSRLGGLHLEVAGNEVRECVGARVDVHACTSALRYESLCDPRLSHSQSLELVGQFATEVAASAPRVEQCSG